MDGFTLIADPNRRRILDLVAEQSCDVGELVTQLGVSQPLVSKHLRVLRDHGAVRVSVRGRRRVYDLAEDAGDSTLGEVLGWVRPYARRWSRSLDALERVLDEDHPPRRHGDGSAGAARSRTEGRPR